MKIEYYLNENSREELLPQVIDRILAICKYDSNFHLKDDMELLDGKIEELAKKIDRQILLLNRSETLTNDLKQRIDIIQNQNEQKQMELLELLGSNL